MKLSWSFFAEKFLNKINKNFWILLGPIFLLIAYLLLHCKSSFALSVLGFVSLIGYYLSWKFSFRGLALSLCGMGLSLGLLAIFSPNILGGWQWVWSLCLCITLLLITLSSKEYNQAKYKEDESVEKKISELNHRYKKELDTLLYDCDQFSHENKELKEKLEVLCEKIHSYKQLSVASKEESDKYFSESERLYEEIKNLHIELSKYKEMAIDEKINASIVRKQRKLLNDIRTQNLQYKILLEDFRKNAGANSKRFSTLSSIDNDQKKSQLKIMEQDREILIQSYVEKIRGYEAIKEKFKTFFHMDEMLDFKDSQGSFVKTYEDLTSHFEAFGQGLHELRCDIFKLEGQILDMKKELTPSHKQEQTVQGYLTIADQECLRLEKENQVLLELLAQNLNYRNKKKVMES